MVTLEGVSRDDQCRVSVARRGRLGESTIPVAAEGGTRQIPPSEELERAHTTEGTVSGYGAVSQRVADKVANRGRLYLQH